MVSLMATMEGIAFSTIADTSETVETVVVFWLLSAELATAGEV